VIAGLVRSVGWPSLLLFGNYRCDDARGRREGGVPHRYRGTTRLGRERELAAGDAAQVDQGARSAKHRLIIFTTAETFRARRNRLEARQ
jgi:hypothetical protein